MTLAEINFHSRDSKIALNSRFHQYTVEGGSSTRKYTSVTQFVSASFPCFNADAVIQGMRKSSNWKNSTYYGKTAVEIKALWKRCGQEAAQKGTQLHRIIELYYNNHEIEYDETDVACLYFLKWDKDTEHLWTPYRTEWKIFHAQFQLAGTVDAVFRRSDGSYHLVDWKRSKKIKKDNPWRKCFAPVGHLPDCNFFKYSLQLNIYRFILESQYSLSISQMSIVCLHPENENSSYLCFDVPILEKEVENLLKQRTEAVAVTS